MWNHWGKTASYLGTRRGSRCGRPEDGQEKSNDSNGKFIRMLWIEICGSVHGVFIPRSVAPGDGRPDQCPDAVVDVSREIVDPEPLQVE